MKNGEVIFVQKCGNGWMVMPKHADHQVLAMSEIHVFQTLDYDEHGVQSEKCLLGWIKRHFSGV